MNELSSISSGLLKMREKFPAHQISQLPKGGRMLDFVGHAALTDRLLDADAAWTWEPLAFGTDGLPAIDANGGLWIKLTICGVTRLGYGSADGKTGGNAIKELIGDCLLRGTLITTKRGAVPIEIVRVGDMVPTRGGWRPVTAHWKSSDDAPLRAVSLSNGLRIVGTPNHRVPTGQGVKRLEALRLCDTMHAWQDTENTRAQKILSGAAAYTDATRCIQPCTGSATTWQQRALARICTVTFGRLLTASSRTVRMFITRTAIGATIPQRILRPSLLLSMARFMGRLSRFSLSTAMSAAGSSRRAELSLAGAVQLARNEDGAWMGSPTSGRHSRQSWLSTSAQSAASNSHPLSHGQSFAPVFVVGLADAGKGEVWNLSVGDVHEYVANGVLVMNSLRNAAMRFGAALDLWHKGDLHVDEADDKPPATTGAANASKTPQECARLIAVGVAAGDALGAVTAMSEWDDALYESVWKLLDTKTANTIAAAFKTMEQPA